LYYADQLDSPVTSNWAVNAFAPASADSANSALVIRRFDDTLEEGVGFTLESPVGATNAVLSLKSRVQTAQTGAAKYVVPKLYVREIPDNLAVTSWSAGTRLTPLDFTNNTFFQYDSQTVTLATLGLTAGRTAQFELTRVGSDATDTVSGDWDLFSIGLSFT
jgi:hypothetical protein